MTCATILIIVTFTLGCQAQIDLGTCNLQCDGDKEGSPTINPHPLPTRVRGPPGKRGVTGLKGSKGDPGLRGPKGDPAEKCNCHGVEDLKRAMFPRSCSDVPTNGGVYKSGVYTIYPNGDGDLTHFRVYCDLETDGGGWTVFQKRIDGSEDFYRNFFDYVMGFGELDGEFWLGLGLIHRLTKDGEYKMRVDMEDFDNQTRHALYNDFVVGAGMNYTLTVGGYSGNAGHALRSARFSAKDRDQDTSSASCSNIYNGGWWYTACHAANPNGLYLRGPHESYADGIDWIPWRGAHYSLKRIEMKLKKK